MADEIKKEEPKTEVAKAVNDGFKPISTGDQPAPQRAGGQRGGGFGPASRQGGQNRRPGFGRAGFGKDRPKDDFQTKLLDLARVTRVTGGGKRMSFRAVVVAGDKKGKVGIGIDKGKDVSQAIEKATRRAKRDLVNVIIVEGTIPHEVEAKSGPAVILLKPQKKGRGLVAGGAVRMICDLAGIKNISSKILSGSKNKLNNARATMEALKKLKAKSS
ncbi:MAG: 30S ribosomal protein S5 [Candidatus Staskawiczbacteria bacterium]|nr:30S ribosomal protein S5 [Candidatus Staskawiczbacteria bacterium]